MTIFEEIIRKINGKWYLYTADGKRKLGGPYSSRKQAVKRERQVQYFKHLGQGEKPMSNILDELETLGEVAGLKFVIGFKKAGGSETQSVLFAKAEKWTPAKAKKWLKDHDMASGDMDETDEYFRFRQSDPGGFIRFRIVEPGKQKEVEVNPDDALLEKLYEQNCTQPEVAIPFGVTSFADMQKAQDALETAHEVQDTATQFIQIVNNIFSNQDITDKAAAIIKLTYELSDLIPSLMGQVTGGETQAAEAATIKSKAISAIRALSNLVGDKSLPKTLVVEIEHLYSSMKKTWANLATEAEEEWARGVTETETVPEIMPETPPAVPAVETERLTESYDAPIVDLEEVMPSENSVLSMNVALIRPGFGNERDNHYYPAEMLKRDAHKFVGSKMYETDHKQSEKSTRTWVSTVTGINGFQDDGSPIGKVVIHDPSFAERVKNLKTAGLLNMLECSILADGVAKPGFEKDGRKGKMIETIAKVDSVDWVTKAGAGGHALSIMEGAAEAAEPTEASKTPLTATPPPAPPVPAPEPITVDIGEAIPPATTETETEPVAEAVETLDIPDDPFTVVPEIDYLESPAVQEVLNKSNLPQIAKDKLAKGRYTKLEEVEAAVKAESDYLKEIRGSGRPFGQGNSNPVDQKPKSQAEYNARIEEIIKRHKS